MPREFALDEEKARELILYISERCADAPTFGATVLNKVLWAADFLMYAQRGQPITGFEYQKLPFGPAPRRLLPIRERMREEGILGVQEITLRGAKVQQRTVNLRRANLGVFTAEEIAMVERALEWMSGMRAKQVSDLSHELLLGWQAAAEGETIPYATVFASSPPLSEEEKLRGGELAGRLAAGGVGAKRGR